MSICRWLAAGLMLALVVPAGAQEPKPVKLEWKFEKDKPFYQTVVTETIRDPKPMDKDAKPDGGKPDGAKPGGAKPDGAKPEPQKPDSKQIFYLSWTPIKQDDKNWILKMKIEGVNLLFNMAGANIAYDSTGDAKPSGVLPVFYSKLVGAELTFTPSDTATVPTKGHVLDHIGFDVKDLVGLAKQLEAEGVKLDQPIVTQPSGAKLTFIHDPWGTSIELNERPNPL